MKLNNRSNNKIHTKLQDTKSNVEYNTHWVLLTMGKFFLERKLLSLTSMLKKFDETEYRSQRLGSFA